MKKLIKIIIILAVLVGPSVYGYFWLISRIEKNQAAERSRMEEIKKKNLQTDTGVGLLKQQKADKEKADAYAACMNKAYKEYRVKYDEECSKKVIDGICQVTNEKLYEIQGIYMADKQKCEELKK